MSSILPPHLGSRWSPLMNGSLTQITVSLHRTCLHGKNYSEEGSVFFPAFSLLLTPRNIFFYSFNNFLHYLCYYFVFALSHRRVIRLALLGQSFIRIWRGVFKEGGLQMPGKWEWASWQLYSMNKLIGWRNSSEYRWISLLNWSAQEIFKPLKTVEKCFLNLLISCLTLLFCHSHTFTD